MDRMTRKIIEEWCAQLGLHAAFNHIPGDGVRCRIMRRKAGYFEDDGIFTGRMHQIGIFLSGYEKGSEGSTR